jgi:L-amino acid N-acyltransferase YncA
VRSSNSNSDMRPSDWQWVRQIYLDGLATGQASFETEAPGWPGFRIVGQRERIAQHSGVWRDTVITERRSKVVGT